MTNSKAKIAVIGTGYWGKNLVRNFAELGSLHAICDENQETLNEQQEKHNIQQTFTSYKDVLASESIDAVVIATPAVTHHEIAKAAILAGKDIFVEKPLSLKVKEAEELIGLAKAHNKILMVDHILQYHPAVIKLKELIDNGTLGKLQYIYSNRLNIGKLRHEENILWSFAPHDISVILSLAGQAPQAIRVFGEAYVQDAVVDSTITYIDFKDRLKAHIFVSWLHPYKEQKLVVIGNKAMAVFDDMNKEHKLVLYPHKIEWVNQVPVAEKAEQEIIALESKEPLKEACLHFIDCLETRNQPRTDGNEALAVLKILEQAQEELDLKNEKPKKIFRSLFKSR